MSTGRFAVPMYGLGTKLAAKTAHDAAIHVELSTPFGLRDVMNRDLGEAIDQIERHVDNISSANVTYDNVVYTTPCGKRQYESYEELIVGEAQYISDVDCDFELEPTYDVRYKRREAEEHYSSAAVTFKEAIRLCFEEEMFEISLDKLSNDQIIVLKQIRKLREHVCQ